MLFAGDAFECWLLTELDAAIDLSGIDGRNNGRILQLSHSPSCA